MNDLISAELNNSRLWMITKNNFTLANNYLEEFQKIAINLMSLRKE